MLVNGIYILERDQTVIGFNPHNLLLFKMSPLVHDIVRAFPKLEPLFDRYPAEKVKGTLEGLLKNHILFSAPPPLPNSPPLPRHYSDFTFLLSEKKKQETTGKAGVVVMNMDTLDNAIDLFLQETHSLPSKTLTLMADDFLPLLPQLRQVMQRVKRQGTGHIDLILRTPGFPLPLEVLKLAVRFDAILHLEWQPGHHQDLFPHIQSKLLQWQQPQYTKHRKLFAQLPKVARLPLGAIDETHLPSLMEMLQTAGIYRVYRDLRCDACQNGSPGSAAIGETITRRMLDYRLYKNTQQRQNVAGFQDHLPPLHTLLASQRRFYGCAAGISYIAVSASGHLSPCHTVTNVTHDHTFQLGHVAEALNKEHLPRPQRTQVHQRQACSGCQGRYICGGGSNLKDLTVSENYCRTFLTFFHQLLPLYGTLDMTGKNIVLSEQPKTNRYLPHIKPLVPPNRHPIPPEGEELTVRSDSMKPLIEPGDKVRVVPIDGQQVRVGDIICYSRPVICHRAIARIRRNRVTYILEKGDNILAGKRILQSQVTGKVVSIIKGNRQLPLTTPSQTLSNKWRALRSLLGHWLTVVRVRIRKRGTPL